MGATPVNTGLAQSILQNAVNQAGSAASGISGINTGLLGLASGIPSNYTPAQQSSILSAVLGGIQNQYNAARRRASDIAGRTGSYASLLPTMSSLTNKEASDLSSAGGKLTQQFAQFPTEQAKAKAGIYDAAARNLAAELMPYLDLAGRAVQPATGYSLLDTLLAGMGGTAASTAIGTLLPSLLGKIFGTGAGSVDLGSLPSVGADIGPAIASAVGGLF